MWAANHLSVVWAAVGTVGGVAALIGLWVAARRYRSPDAAAAWTVVWLAAAAAVGQWSPVPGQAHSPGLLNLAAAAAGVCAGAVCALMITRAHLGVFSAIAVGAGVVATVAVMLRLTNLAQSALAAGLLITGLIALSAMPQLVQQLARISPRRLLAVGEDIGAAREFTDGVLAKLQDRARRAVQLRSSLTILTAGVVAAAAVWTLDPHSGLLPVEIGIVACTALILALRGRMMTDRTQAYALFAAAAATIFVSAGRLILAWPTGWRPAVVFGVVALTTATWVICALVASARPMTPVLLHWAKRVEEVGIVLVIPLCVWVSGTFAVIRNLAMG
jgi:type VII secretion integral membrane protein EccD